MASTLLSPEEAGRMAGIMSDYGETPMFTNKPERANDPNSVYADMSPYESINNRPSDDDMDFTEKMHKFVTSFEKSLPDPNYEAQIAYRDFLQQNKPNVPFADEKITKDTYKMAEFIAAQTFGEVSKTRQGILRTAMDKFKEDYSGGFGGKQPPKVKGFDENNQPVYETKKGLLYQDGTAYTGGRLLPTTQTPQEQNREKNSFEKWDAPSKESAFVDKILSNKEPKWTNRDAEYPAFNKEYRDYLVAKGIDQKQINAIQTENKALDRSFVFQQKNRDMLEGFVLNIDKQVDKITDLMNGGDIKRFGVRFGDMGIRELKTRLVGSGAERQLEAYLREVSTEIAKVTTGSQASIAEVSVEAQKVWSNIHDKNLSFEELNKVLQATKQQGMLRLQSVEEVMSETKNKQLQLIDKYSTKPQNSSENQPTQKSAMPKIGEVRNGFKFKGGNPNDKNSWEKA